MAEDPPFSEAGLDEAEEYVRVFVSELRDEAGRVARRVGAEEASPDHVRRAAEHLYMNRPARWSQGAVALGGLLAGAGLSGVVSAFLTDPISVAVAIGSIVLTVIGSVMMTAGLLR